MKIKATDIEHRNNLKSARRGPARGHIARTWFAVIAVPCACLLLVQAVDGDWLKRTEPRMGTEVHVEVWAEDDAASRVAGEAAVTAVYDEFSRLEAMMSPFQETSDLSRLNREGANRWVVVPVELFDVVARSLKVSALTNGAFDVTFASVGRYYDYRKGKKPDAATVASKLPLINYRHLQMDAVRHAIRFGHPGVYVDLGGIAKGYAVDRAVALLGSRGYLQFMVGAGGDSRIVGNRRGKPWIIGIKDPRGDEPIALLPLENVAVSTSGDYERYFERDGVRYHHILDPKTGDSAREVQSATILGKESTWTDALSTSVFVLGVQKGLALINGLGDVDAIVIDRDGRLHYSQTLMQLKPRDPPVPPPASR